MYAVIDSSKRNAADKLVAYHDKKKIVRTYYEALKKTKDSDKFTLVKCKKKHLKKIPEYYEYYLIRLGNNYIPAMYYEFAKDDFDTMICEYKYVIEILSRVFEFGDMSDSERHNVKKTIITIQELLDNELSSVVSPDVYKRMEELYKEFKYNSGIPETTFNKDDYIPFFDFSEI